MSTHAFRQTELTEFTQPKQPEEIEFLEEPFLATFLKLEDNSHRNLLRVSLYEHEVATEGEPKIARSVTSHRLYLCVLKHRVPGTMIPDSVNKIFLTRQINDSRLGISPTGKEVSLETIVKKSAEHGSWAMIRLLTTAVSLKLREAEQIRPFEGRLTRYVIGDAEKRVCSCFIHEHRVDLNIELVPTVLFSSRFYGEDYLGIAIRARCAIMPTGSLYSIYQHELNGDLTLLKAFVSIFKRYKIVPKPSKPAYGFLCMRFYESPDKVDKYLLDLSDRFFKHVYEEDVSFLEEPMIEGFPLSFMVRKAYGHKERETIALPISLVRPVITMEEGAKMSTRVEADKDKEERSLSAYLLDFSSLINKREWILNFVEIVKGIQPIEVQEGIEITFDDLIRLKEVILL